MPDYMRHLEQAVQFGMPVLLQNVMEKLDASLDPVLNKSVMRVGELRCCYYHTVSHAWRRCSFHCHTFGGRFVYVCVSICLSVGDNSELCTKQLSQSRCPLQYGLR